MNSSLRTLTLAATLFMVGCAPTLPFQSASPRLTALTEESRWLDRPAGFDPNEVAASEMPRLALRIDNLLRAYDEELDRARGAQGGALNTLLKVAGLVLPVSGTATSLLVSDPDDAAAIAAAAGGATTVVAALNTFLKPGEAAAAASACENFLVGAIASLESRWPRASLSTVPDDAAEWDLYFAVRSGLEVGRRASCPG